MTFDIKNYVPPRERKPAASSFYNHPYGGIARDITVTREGFMRFWELDEYQMAQIESYHFNGKVCDVQPSYFYELLGYLDHGKYSITIINRTHGALMDHAVRTLLPSHPH